MKTDKVKPTNLSLRESQVAELERMATATSMQTSIPTSRSAMARVVFDVGIAELRKRMREQCPEAFDLARVLA